MKTHFYSHIIDVGPLHIELSKLELSDLQKKELEDLVHGTVHHDILDSIMSELNNEDKKTFLLHLEKEDVQEIWNLLKAKVENVEEKIKKAGEKTLREFVKDVQDLQ